MRFEGNLAVWNADRGYGAIIAQQGGQELFVHISSFPKEGAPPLLGEPLSFEIVSGGDGRKQAARVLRSKRVAAPSSASFMAPAPPRRRLQQAQRKRRLTMGAVALAVIVGVLGWAQVSKPHLGQQLAQRVSATAIQR